MAKRGGVAAGDVVFELALYVAEQAAGAEAKEVWRKPRRAKLFFH